MGSEHNNKMSQRGAVWALCTDEQGQGCPAVVALQGAASSHCEAPISRRKSLSWSCHCREPRPFFSSMALWLCLGEALKGALQGIKGEMVGAHWWQKRSAVSTTSSGHWFTWVCVWGAAVPSPVPSHAVFVCADGSWGKAAARRGCMERPAPPLRSASVFKALPGMFISSPSADPG